MKERPILMSAPTVRAILAGLKTQTRRGIKCPSTGAFVCVQGYWTSGTAEDWWPLVSADGESVLDDEGNETPMRCPYGKPGDRLWVRETWTPNGNNVVEAGKIGRNPLHYRADGEAPEYLNVRWRSPIFMPRWASRITLEITEVRVEQLIDITEEDARAEGIVEWHEHSPYRFSHVPEFQFKSGRGPQAVSLEESAVEAYRFLWELVNGPGSWNPYQWVWAITFKVV